jgi:uracil-DNA glycosylase family 4
MSLTTLIKECCGCPLRDSLDPTLSPVASTDWFRAKIALVKMLPNLDAHLEDNAYSLREELLIERICKKADVPRDDIYVTNLIKCMSDKTTGLKKNAEACSPFLREEVQHKSVIVLGKATATLFKKIVIDKPFYEAPSLHELYRGSSKAIDNFAQQMKEIYLANA